MSLVGLPGQPPPTARFRMMCIFLSKGAHGDHGLYSRGFVLNQPEEAPQLPSHEPAQEHLLVTKVLPSTAKDISLYFQSTVHSCQPCTDSHRVLRRADSFAHSLRLSFHASVVAWSVVETMGVVKTCNSAAAHSCQTFALALADIVELTRLSEGSHTHALIGIVH